MVDQIGKKPKRSWTRHADNRARLIAAGYAILAEKGIEATTVKEIAGRAGVSPGLFHYYFKTKDELLLAVLYEAGGRFREMVQDMQAAFSEQGFAGAAVAKLQAVSREDPTWYRLRYELYALGLRKPEFLPKVAKLLAAARAGITGVIMQFTGVEEEQAKALAALVLAVSDGLALQQIAQPDFDLSGAYDLVRLLLAGESPAEH